MSIKITNRNSVPSSFHIPEKFQHTQKEIEEAQNEIEQMQTPIKDMIEAIRIATMRKHEIMQMQRGKEATQLLHPPLPKPPAKTVPRFSNQIGQPPRWANLTASPSPIKHPNLYPSIIPTPPSASPAVSIYPSLSPSIGTPIVAEEEEFSMPISEARETIMRGELTDIRKAEVFGYNGSDADEAKKYLEGIMQETKLLCKDRLLDKKHVAYKTGTIIRELDLETTLRNLHTLTSTEIFALFSKREGLYQPSYSKLASYLLRLTSEGRITKTTYTEIGYAQGIKALHLAVKQSKKDTVELLVRHGINPNIPYSEDGFTPLMEAVSKGDLSIAKLLFKLGTEVDMTNRDGKTAFFYAACRGDKKMIGLLLKHGATIDVPHDANSETRLIYNTLMAKKF